MAELEIGSDNYRNHTETNDEGVSFVVLGRQIPKRTRTRPARLRRRTRKIRRQIKGEAEDVWGTLGMDGARELTWRGRLRYSEKGNTRSLPEESMPVTCKEINLIRETIPEAVAGNHKILERYISLEDVTFDNLPDSFSDDNLPRLRLTVMLQPDEGALVYYQLYPAKNKLSSEKDRAEVDLEYIQPNPTPAHKCDERDRLDYSIPLLASRKIEEKNDGTLCLSKALNERFVIKILTFKRNNAESDTIMRRIYYHIWGRSHELVRWNPASGDFQTIDGSALRSDKKALFLIHGTMSSTGVAFQDLLAGNTNSWLAGLHENANGPYGQIIGFNHPTFSEDASMNAEALLERLPKSFEFREGVDLITHSRGGLLGKYIAQNISPLHIERGALVACANGVGYFTTGRRIAKLLSVLRAGTSAAPVLKGLMALAQHSGEFLMKQPGARLMTPGSDRLTELLDAKPKAAPPLFLPVVGNFDSSLVAHHGFFRRWAERGLDVLIKASLGRRHDWVVGAQEQYIAAPGRYPAGWSANKLKSSRIHTTRHSGFFAPKNGNVKNPAPDRIKRFLQTGKTW